MIQAQADKSLPPSHGGDLPPPSDRTFRFRPTTRVGVAVAVLVSAATVWASSRFVRKAPNPIPSQPGMSVSNSGVALTPDAPQWQVIELETAKAITNTWTDPIPAFVKVDESKAARIGVPLAGRVTQVNVELGQLVTKGMPLFAVASPDLAALQVEQSKAKVDLEAAQGVLDRTKAIVDARALPEKEAVAAAQQLKQSELSLNVAQSKLSSLDVTTRSENEFVVHAPRAGRVVEKNVLPGQELQPGGDAALMLIADLSTVWVVADLFESDSDGVLPGVPARVTITSLPGVVIDGKVDMVSAVVDPDRHTVPVRVVLDNSDGRLKPNTYAKMQFQANTPPGSVEVAASALVSDGAKQYAYVKNAQGRFVKRDVVAGAVRDGRVVVFKGIAPGETVVSKGAILLDNQIDLAE
ncbi:MAG TPA: efflux RND transporter periplasmic adaptor subunit [Polyangiaceae bacterium]|jgi:RND family efflux transporter MFP subunit|nr:efflux RND transporter periplasmic adaptor subunit [Polyangiaceae bacterium]